MFASRMGAVGLCLLAVLMSPIEAADQPNIIVFLVDDMGVMDSSVAFLTDEDGQAKRYPLNEFYRTPSMERLAEQGIRFSQFYAMSVCSPTRVSIMTGKNSARHHTTQWIRPEMNNRGEFGPPDWQWKGISPDVTTLPALLHEAGYQTIHCGKAHFGPNDSFGENPANFGFDVNIAGRAIGAPGSYYGTDDFGHKTRRAHNAVNGLEKYHGEDIYLTEALTREIKRDIASAVKQDKPFFAYMSHYAVHAPFQPDPRFISHYDDSDKPPQAKVFASMIEGMDQSLGDLLDHVEQLGQAENTLVFFLGDNGTDAPLGPLHEIACAAPLRGKKGTHYEGGMRVPFIAAWAKPSADHAAQKRLPIPQGMLVEEYGVVHDLFPTVLQVAGVDVPQGLDGINLAPQLTQSNDSARQVEFLMHFPHDHRSSYFTAYRRGDWKIIYHYRKPAVERYELFDLATDPTESDNLAGRRPEKLREMTLAMTKALEHADAQFPVAEDGRTPVQPIVPPAD